MYSNIRVRLCIDSNKVLQTNVQVGVLELIYMNVPIMHSYSRLEHMYAVKQCVT